MSPHTVALQPHTGRIGSAAFKELLKAHNEGKIVLVVIHRPGSDLSTVPAGVEAREVNLAEPDEAKIKESLKGINIYASAVGASGLGDQIHLFKPLSETPGFVTYLCPLLGQPRWTSEEGPEDERIAKVLAGARELIKTPQKLGVGVTKLACGVFTDFLFDVKYVGTDFDANKVVLPTGADTKGLPLISSEGLGKEIAEITTRDPQSVKNKTFYTFDFNPTGNEIIKVFTKIHGKPSTVVDWTEEDYQKEASTGTISVTSAVYKRNWGSGDWRWEGERLGSRDGDFEKLAQGYWEQRQKAT